MTEHDLVLAFSTATGTLAFVWVVWMVVQARKRAREKLEARFRGLHSEYDNLNDRYWKLYHEVGKLRDRGASA